MNTPHTPPQHDPDQGEDSEMLLAAELAGLRYVSDSERGFGRQAAKVGFDYLDRAGKPLRQEAHLKRIKALAIPPAWTQVWISPWANGHIQATGRDARGRKQYRYHKLWREARDEVKYERMLSFGLLLPKLRARVDADLALPGLPRDKVVATVIYLLEHTMMRIGNEEYARSNRSFGLTTLRNRHVSLDGREVEFHFRGKSRVEHKVKVTSARLARIIKGVRELPGQDLFQYVDADGQRHTVGSSDVNAYLQEVTGEHYTAKDFRTWSGTIQAAQVLRQLPEFASQAEAKRNINQAITAAAKKLGNTPTICRKCYIHPQVLEAYLDRSMFDSARRTSRQIARHAKVLDEIEVFILSLLQHKLQA